MASALLVHQYSQSILAQFPDLVASIATPAVSGVAGNLTTPASKSTLLEIYLALTKMEISAEHAISIVDAPAFQVKCFKYICGLLGVQGCLCDEIITIFNECVANGILGKLFGCCL
jgi:hypothetical protein